MGSILKEMADAGVIISLFREKGFYWAELVKEINGREVEFQGKGASLFEALVCAGEKMGVWEDDK